jgi:hypothetical protein
MSKPRAIHCYDYVPRPYAQVRDALVSDASGILRRATAAAGSRSEELLAHLHMDIAGLDLGTDIAVRIEGFAEEGDPAGKRGLLRLSWAAAERPRLFPTMDAELHLYSLAPDETQLELRGLYAPPLGFLGKAIDAALLHRAAEACVHRLLREAAVRLAAELPEHPVAASTGGAYIGA